MSCHPPHCTPLHDLDLQQAGTVEAHYEEHDARLCAQHPDLPGVVTCSRCGNYACERCVHGAVKAPVCTPCHARFAEIRAEHLRTEGRLVSCAIFMRWALWAALVLCTPLAVLLAVRSGQVFAGISFVSGPLLGAFVLVPRARLLQRLEPAGRNSLVLLGLGLLAGMPLGWLLLPMVGHLAYGERGRRVLSPDYAQVLRATPDMRAEPSRGLLITLALVAIGQTLFLALSMLGVLMDT